MCILGSLHFIWHIEAKNNIWTNCETSFLLYLIHPILILSGKNTSNRGSVCWKHTPSSTELSEQAVKHSQHSPCSYLLHKRSPGWNYCSMLKVPFLAIQVLICTHLASDEKALLDLHVFRLVGFWKNFVLCCPLRWGEFHFWKCICGSIYVGETNFNQAKVVFN